MDQFPTSEPALWPLNDFELLVNQTDSYPRESTEFYDWDQDLKPSNDLIAQTLAPDSPTSYSTPVPYSPLDLVRHGFNNINLQPQDYSPFNPPQQYNSIQPKQTFLDFDQFSPPHSISSYIQSPELHHSHRKSHPFSLPTNAFNYEDISKNFSEENSESSADDVEGEVSVGKKERAWIQEWELDLRLEAERERALQVQALVERNRYNFMRAPFLIPLNPNPEVLQLGTPIHSPVLKARDRFIEPIPFTLGHSRNNSLQSSTNDPTPKRKNSVKKRSETSTFVPSESEGSESDDNDAGFSPSSSTSPIRNSLAMSRSKSHSTSQSSNAFSDDSLSKSVRKRVQQPNKARRRRRTLAPPGAIIAGGGTIACSLLEADGTACTVVFRRLYDLTRHKETIHGEVPMITGAEAPKKVEWHCEPCGGYFSRKDALIRHKRVRNC